MKHFLVVQHTYSEFLGLIETRLEQRDIGFTYVRPFTGQSLPGTALQHDALWLLGGAYPVTDTERQPWIDDELRLIALFQRARRPVVGLGFGGLLLARAAGGTARTEPAHSAYWSRALATEAGRDDPLAQAVDGRRVLVLYNGAVDLPEGVPPLVVDEQGRWIAARPGEAAYALLFRPELKPGMLEDMIMEEGRTRRGGSGPRPRKPPIESWWPWYRRWISCRSGARRQCTASTWWRNESSGEGPDRALPGPFPGGSAHPGNFRRVPGRPLPAEPEPGSVH
jgi:GMP synthase-like glutamine amidotransferase